MYKVRVTSWSACTQGGGEHTAAVFSAIAHLKLCEKVQPVRPENLQPALPFQLELHDIELVVHLVDLRVLVGLAVGPLVLEQGPDVLDAELRTFLGLRWKIHL